MPELAPVTKATFSLSLIFNLHHEKQMKPRMNTDVHSAAQPQPKKSTARTRRTRRKAISKTSRSSRLRGFVVKAASNPPRRLEESRRVSGQWKNSFQLEKDFGVSSTDLYRH